jgi:hypothetical protein
MSFYQNIKDKPFYQAAVCLGLSVLLILLIGLIHWISPDTIGAMEIWTSVTGMFLFYILFNIVLGFSQRRALNYYRDSVYGYIALLAISILLAQWVTGSPLMQAKTYAWIIWVFTFVYILFMAIQGLIRKIVDIALKQDQKLRDENH